MEKFRGIKENQEGKSIASNVTLNGVVYSIPAEGDSGWSTALTNFFISIGSNVLQKTGGTFTLTAEAYFGATYGLKSAYLKSTATNPSATGVLRLGNAELLAWRNAANSADLGLTVSSGNLLQFNGSTIVVGSGGAGVIVNADVSASAAIAYSKLAALTIDRALISSGAGVVSVSAVTATELGYLSGLSSSAQTQISAKAPSASPTFSGTITTPLTASRALTIGASSELAASATTATELAFVNGVTSAIQTQLNAKSPSASPTFSGTITTPLTASRALTIGASNELAVSATTAAELAYVNGVTSSIQTQLDAKVAKSTFTTKGDLLITTAASTVTRLAVSGTDGFLLTEDSASAGGVKWATAPSSPSSSLSILNAGLAASVATNAMTIALKQASGSDPSTGANVVTFGFRNETATTGQFAHVSSTAATSIVIPSGATMGSTSANANWVYVYAINNAGTVELAVSGCKTFDEGSILDTTIIDTSSDSALVLYSTTARTGVACRLIGRVKSTQATAGTWATSPAELSLVPFENDSHRSEYWYQGGNGYGSTNTAIRKYSNLLVGIGTDITASNSATAGLSYTINKPGVYTISMCEGLGAVSSWGISLNSAQLTTDTSTITASTCLFAGSIAVGNYLFGTAVTLYLTTGDVVRPHNGGAAGGTYDNRCGFRIAKVSN